MSGTHTPNKPSYRRKIKGTTSMSDMASDWAALEAAGHPNQMGAQGSAGQGSGQSQSSSATARAEIDVNATKIENNIRGGLDMSPIEGENITKAEVDINIDTTAIENRLREEFEPRIDVTVEIAKASNDISSQANIKAEKALQGATWAETAARAATEAVSKMEPAPIVLLDSTMEQVGEITGLRHKQAEVLLKSMNVRGKSGDRKNIWITGKKGGGKSTAAQQCAEALGLSYNYIGRVNMAHEVIGSVNQVSGVYKGTPFTKAFIEGGAINFEEVDGNGPGALLTINTALANGVLALPNGEVHLRHKDCVVIACANTWGSGATSEYVGRSKLDDAFLDRFGIKIHWEYDMDLEVRAAQNDEVVNNVQLCRMNAEKAGLQITISPRSSIDIADMMRAGFEMKEAFEMNFLAGLNDDQRRTVLEGVSL